MAPHTINTRRSFAVAGPTIWNSLSADLLRMTVRMCCVGILTIT